jgi:predicted enzyme related to lactoylglutathione lyase
VADYLVLTLDCSDAKRLAEFWCTALGYEVAGGAGQYTMLTIADGTLPKMLLQQVVEAKQAKNRLHLDIHVPDIEAEATRLEAAGATRLGRYAELETTWISMADPEGNEFCVCPT